MLYVRKYCKVTVYLCLSGMMVVPFNNNVVVDEMWVLLLFDSNPIVITQQHKKQWRFMTNLSSSSSYWRTNRRTLYHDCTAGSTAMRATAVLSAFPLPGVNFGLRHTSAAPSNEKEMEMGVGSHNCMLSGTNDNEIVICMWALLFLCTNRHQMNLDVLICYTSWCKLFHCNAW